MKRGWEEKKLGEILIIERGGSPRPISSYITESPDGINWIKIGDTKGVTKYITETKEKIKPEGVRRSRMVYEGDFILSNSMSFGRPYIMKTTGCIHDGWLVLRPKEKNIDPDFLYHLLGAPIIFSQFDNLAAGSTVRNLNINLVKSVSIPLPPLPEQKRIVGILDKAFAAISTTKANAEKNLQNARELFESYLQGIFANPGEGWEEKKLKEVGTTQTETTPKTSSRENYGKFIPFIKPADININGDGEIRYDNDGLSEAGLNNGRTILKDSVLIVCIGASIGKVGFADRQVSCNQQINTLTVRKGLMGKFFYYALSTKTFFQEIIKNSAQATLPIINKSKWENLLVQFPKSLTEQRAIVAKLDELSAETKKLESLYQQKIADFEELKKSVLQKAFNGEL